MFTQRRIVSRVEFCLLVFLFYGVMIGAARKWLVRWSLDMKL